MYVGVCTHIYCHITCVEVRGQLLGAGNGFSPFGVVSTAGLCIPGWLLFVTTTIFLVVLGLHPYV